MRALSPISNFPISKISALLDECEGLLVPYNILKAQKWVFVSDTNKRLDTFIDKKGSIAYTYGIARQQIRNLQSYKEARAEFEKDEIFSAAAKVKTDNLYTFGSVIEHIIINTAIIKDKVVVIDHTKAIHVLEDIRKTLVKKALKYEASARLMGVTLTAKTFTLPDDIAVHRLTKKERNDKQPTSPEFSLLKYQDLTDHPAELRVSFKVTIDCSQVGTFSNAHFKANKIARERFNKVVDAILVATSGNAKLSFITLKGGIDVRTGSSQLQELPLWVNITIRKGDIKNISAVYGLLSRKERGDKTLSRALHRFLLGRKRPDLVDKLVDYIIAWESILLTHKGNSIKQELIYRFSLNGASIISSADRNAKPREIFKKMKCAYNTRSTIVHGGSDKNIKNDLKGNFANTNELCNFLEYNFRQVVFWLISLDAGDRPYQKKEGWELLIWP